MNLLFAFLALSALQDPTPAEADVQPLPYVPISITIREAPGYFRGVSVGIPENGVIEVQAKALEQTPTKKWSATTYIALINDTSSTRYYLNLSTDRDLQQQYVRARTIDKDSGKELSNHTHQELFPLSSVVTLKIEIKGKTVSSYVNGALVETRDLPFEPDYYDLGASSGSYQLTVLEEEPPPAPESNDAG